MVATGDDIRGRVDWENCVLEKLFVIEKPVGEEHMEDTGERDYSQSVGG
jgi:hypothetical protein